MSNHTGKRILVIDDDAMNREVMEAFLETEDYAVLLAHDGTEGLEKATAETPDLILLDVRMPDIDGYTVCQQLNDTPQTAAIPVIMVSGLDSDDDRQKARDAGAVNFLSRPFSIDDFIATVRETLS